MCYLSSLYRKDEETFYNDMQEITNFRKPEVFLNKINKD